METTNIAKRNYKLTPQQREEVVRRYMLGEKLIPLEKEFGVTKESIRILAKNRGMVTDRRKILPDDIRKYRELAENLCKETIVSERTLIGNRRKLSTKCLLNEDAFANVTAESAYWIGFLMADGCVHKNIITLRLSNEDKYHIKTFRNFIGSSHKLSVIPPKILSNGVKRNEAYQVAFHSKQISSDLARFGIVPRKSWCAKAIGLESNRHFWRGMIDGDGCIYSRSQDMHMSIAFSNTEDIISQFKNFVKIFCPYYDGKIKQHKRSPTSKCINVAGKEAAIIMDVLYHNASVTIPRKSKHALELVDKFIASH